MKIERSDLNLNETSKRLKNCKDELESCKSQMKINRILLQDIINQKSKYLKEAHTTIIDLNNQ